MFTLNTTFQQPQFTHLGAERPSSACSVHCGTPLCPPESSGCLSGSTGTSCEERHHETQTHQAAFMPETTVIMKPLICGFALCACPTTPLARPVVSDLRPGHRTRLFNSIRRLIETTDLGLLHWAENRTPTWGLLPCDTIGQKKHNKRQLATSHDCKTSHARTCGGWDSDSWQRRHGVLRDHTELCVGKSECSSGRSKLSLGLRGVSVPNAKSKQATLLPCTAWRLSSKKITSSLFLTRKWGC